MIAVEEIRLRAGELALRMLGTPTTLDELLTLAEQLEEWVREAPGLGTTTPAEADAPD